MISSRAAKGSSIRRRRGRVTSARAIEARIRIPPESSRGKASANPVRPTRSRARSISFCASGLDRPARRSGRNTLSNTVAQGISVGSWKTNPMSRRAVWEARRTVPEVASAEAGDQPKRGGFPAAGRAENAGERSRPDRKRQAVQRDGAVGERLGDAFHPDQNRSVRHSGVHRTPVRVSPLGISRPQPKARVRCSPAPSRPRSRRDRRPGPCPAFRRRPCRRARRRLPAPARPHRSVR